MPVLRIIDTKDKFLIEIDGAEVSYVTSYSLTKTVSNTVLLKLALAINDVDIEIESDKIEEKINEEM